MAPSTKDESAPETGLEASSEQESVAVESEAVESEAVESDETALNGGTTLADTPETQLTLPEIPDIDADELSQEDMLKVYEDTIKSFAQGEVVRGQVIDVDNDRVLVDIRYKSEGAIPITEFPRDVEIKVGDEFDIFIDDPEGEDGIPVLSKIKADKIKNWTTVQRIYEDDGVATGRVVKRVKGGLKVDIGLDAFLPASQVDWRPTSDLDRYIGETLDFKIIKLTKRRRNVVLSRRKLLEESRAEEKGALLETIEIGKLLEGEVKNITDFGAFVDVGGIDGLLHVTDMSWGRVRHPSQVVQVGQKIEVIVRGFDKQAERISLSLKDKTPDPWLNVAMRYPVDSTIKGQVVSMTDYGAFIHLEEGVEGMVHVSEMSWTKRIRHPADVLDLDQEVEVKVLAIDPENRRIALGLKQTQSNPWMELPEKYPVGTVIEGEIRNLTDYGAFIQIEEGIDGLLHVSDMSWTQKVGHPSEVLQKGSVVKVKILSLDPEHEKVSLGLKQLETDPWEEAPSKYNVGDHIEVTISKLVSFGAFARLDNGIEGLIHVSELSHDRVAKPEDVVDVGQKLTVKVISLDSPGRKIGLSVKDYLRDIEEGDKGKYGTQEGGTVSVGEVVGEAIPASFLDDERGFEQAAVDMLTGEAKPEETAGQAEQTVEQVTEQTEQAADQAEQTAEEQATEPTEQAADADQVEQAEQTTEQATEPTEQATDQAEQAAEQPEPIPEQAAGSAEQEETDREPI